MTGLDKTGPIDNSDLLDGQNKLAKGLSREAYVYAPNEAWYLLKTWLVYFLWRLFFSLFC